MELEDRNLKIIKAEKNNTDTILKWDKHISKQELQNLIQLNRVYIAEQDNQFIGWLRYNLFWDNTPFMNMLYILEEFRRNGYGKSLVEFWETQMKNSGYDIVMTSTASNEYSQHFYNKLGYKTIGGFIITPDPYEIMLSKKL
ncbi:MAG: GNAT family N-acetyltransferase [Lachnospiraceae bacterium]|nr:GNAT family N-acetyltransferase [Lachnospiraceae bacterium]MDE6232673.1 GNAT family N-acetyltransferase [Lachnospiraceae bacterium]